MKVRTVNPGSVLPWTRDTHADTITWGYSTVVNGRPVVNTDEYPSANAAKQAMREKVAQERKRHGLENN